MKCDLKHEGEAEINICIRCVFRSGNWDTTMVATAQFDYIKLIVLSNSRFSFVFTKHNDSTLLNVFLHL